MPLGGEQNNRVLTLSQPVKAFAAKYQNAVPTVAEISAIIPHLQALHTKLITAEVDGVHKRQRDAGWGHLADACASVVKLDEWLCESHGSNFIRAVLLEASDYPDDYRAFGKPQRRFCKHRLSTQIINVNNDGWSQVETASTFTFSLVILCRRKTTERIKLC